ncbi:MAG: arginine repressor [Clostridia bacterium]|nr:arginine repressor [Clostridia bacterium]
MRYARQSKILELIKAQEIDTQERLADKLNQAGFNATQATVSRDIKELGLVKVTGKSGRSCYAEAPKISKVELDKYSKLLKDTVQSIRAAENMIVIKTMAGCANAAAEVIDNMQMDTILGTIAGDNTIFLVIDSKDHVASVLAHFNEAIK